MEISLKLESMPTLCRSAFVPADTTITRRVAATIEVASSVVHLYRHSRKSPATDELALVPRGADPHLILR